MGLVADSAPPPKGINDTILLWRKTVAQRGKDWQNAIRLLFLKEAVSLTRPHNRPFLRTLFVAS
jgi:hypothetical protein